MKLVKVIFARIGLFGSKRDEVFESRLAALTGKQSRLPRRNRPSPFKFASRMAL